MVYGQLMPTEFSVTVANTEVPMRQQSDAHADDGKHRPWKLAGDEHVQQHEADTDDDGKLLCSRF